MEHFNGTFQNESASECSGFGANPATHPAALYSSSMMHQTGTDHARVDIQSPWRARSHFLICVVKQLELSLHLPAPCAPHSRSIFEAHRAIRKCISILARMNLYDTHCTLALWRNQIQTTI